jgi:Flp pilus assembly protein TadD
MAVGISMTCVRAAALMFAGAVLALAAVPSAALAVGVPVYAETPADALARNVRVLADSPKDFHALVGAGKAALDLGDAETAAGFFFRAEEISPASPIPKAGMGAALVMSGDPNAALTYFARAQQLGASAASLGVDRGLAYDLLGKHVVAQTDYRAAMAGPDRDEARRRLALSLAIIGKKDDALATLAPLIARGDSGAARCRALVLALAGDTEGAKQTLNSRMPGSAAAMGPFLRMLPTLSSPQKAAAVNLGIFPSRGTAFASVPSAIQPQGDRLASIEQLLRQPVPQQARPAPSYSYATPAPSAERQRPPVRLASVSRPTFEAATSPRNEIIETKRVASAPGGRKIWLQLASGSNPGELPEQFQRIRSRKPSLFSGISGYVADEDKRARLVIGPFHTEEDARLFAEALETVRIDSFRWVSKPDQVVRKLPAQ